MRFISALLIVMLVTLATVATADEIAVSDDQLFWVNGSWVPARDLRPGDEFLTPDGKTAVVQNVSMEQGSAGKPCYGLDVGSTHDLFANGILVHDNTVAPIIDDGRADVSEPLARFIAHLRAVLERLRQGLAQIVHPVL